MQNFNCRINERIRISPVRVVHGDNHLGLMSNYEALKRARELGLDLVEINPNVKPPVCKIMDYGKYKYEQKKAGKSEKKGHSGQQKIKEVHLRPVTDKHDILVKANACSEWLNHGHKIVVKIIFKNREIQHKQLGLDIYSMLCNNITTKHKASPAKFEGKSLTGFIEIDRDKE